MDHALNVVETTHAPDLKELARIDALELIAEAIDNCGPHAETVANLLVDIGAGVYHAAEDGRLAEAIEILSRASEALRRS
jgi:hypothetical protein